MLDTVDEVYLDAWMAEGRTRGPWTSNQPAGEMPFQRWFKFKEAFAPQFVHETLSNLPYKVLNCLDPFGGSGTTALTCQFLGIRPSTIEINPFMADLIESKLDSYDRVELSWDFQQSLRQAKESWKDLPTSELFTFAPRTFVEPGINGRWLFSLSAAKAVASLLRSVENTSDPKNRRLLKVILGSCLVRLSNVFVNGKGRRYRENWHDRQSSADDVFAAYDELARTAIFDIATYAKRRCLDYSVRLGDAREKMGETEEADVILFSPPYPNSFDYTDIYNVELWMLGYLKSPTCNLALRTGTLRSHVQIKHLGSYDKDLSPTLRQTYDNLEIVRDALWSAHIPEMICRYFMDIFSVLENCRRVIKNGGYTIMAVGDSRYNGVRIDVPQIIQEIAATLNFKCVRKQTVRSMRASAQQGGEISLKESLLYLQLE